MGKIFKKVKTERVKNYRVFCNIALHNLGLYIYENVFYLEVRLKPLNCECKVTV